MKTEHANGFTLLELLVAITVSTILLTIGVPSFLRMVAENERVSYSADLYSALNYARSEAIARNVQVVICKSDSETQCNTSASWSDGWVIYANTNGSVTGTQPEGAAEPILQTHTQLNRFTLTTEDAEGNTGAANNNIANRVVYLPTGRAQNTGIFSLCPENTEISGGQIHITTTGRPRSTRFQCAAETDT